MRFLKRFFTKKSSLLPRAAAVVLPLVIVITLLSQTAFAQTTYVITDGSRVVVHTTYATDPKAVLGEAGLKLGEDDTYTTTTQTGDGTAEIQIQRSQNIRIDYYGETIQAVSNGESVENLLRRLNLTWAPGDTISVPLSTETFDGMELAVAQVMYQDQTYTAVMHHETTYCSDASLPLGTQNVLTPGVDGEMLCSATVTCQRHRNRANRKQRKCDPSARG